MSKKEKRELMLECKEKFNAEVLISVLRCVVCIVLYSIITFIVCDAFTSCVFYNACSTDLGGPRVLFGQFVPLFISIGISIYFINLLLREYSSNIQEYNDRIREIKFLYMVNYLDDKDL